MGCPTNLYDMLMPSPGDEKNCGALEIFQTILLERAFKKALTVYAITVEAGDRPGARVVCETFKSNQLRERNWVEFTSVDAAVVEAGRLTHNKMRNGFHYRLTSVGADFRASGPRVMP